MLLDICIALSAVICINLGVYLFFIRVARTFSIIHEPLLLYLNSIISLYSAVSYVLNLLIYLHYGIQTFTFMIFYIEWAIVTPLFIISLSHIMKLSYRIMLVLSFVDVLCMISGATMEIIADTNLKFIPFTIGVICYIGLFTYLHSEYTKLKRIPIQSILHSNSIRMYKCISICILSSWTLYPIITALHNVGNITDETAIISYSVLDIISKNIYIVIIYYYVLTINNIPHVLDWFTRKRLKIVPIQEGNDSEEAPSAEVETITTTITAPDAIVLTV
jgi:bacteriorhodopsin